MSKETIIILLGIWVAVVPYLGFPSSWRTILIVLSGALIALIGLLLRGENLSRGAHRSASRTFVENGEGRSPSDREIV